MLRAYFLPVSKTKKIMLPPKRPWIGLSTFPWSARKRKLMMLHGHLKKKAVQNSSMEWWKMQTCTQRKVEKQGKCRMYRNDVSRCIGQKQIKLYMYNSKKWSYTCITRKKWSYTCITRKKLSYTCITRKNGVIHSYTFLYTPIHYIFSQVLGCVFLKVHVF